MYRTRLYRYCHLSVTILIVSLLPLCVYAAPAEDQYALAARYYQQARWEEASAEFQEFLRRYPNHEYARVAAFFRAEALVLLGKYDEAKLELEQYLRQYVSSSGPVNPYAKKALFRLGETAYFGDHDEQARQQLTRFFELYPDDSLCAYVLPYLGELALRAERPEQAKDFYLSAIRRFPRGPAQEKNTAERENWLDMCRFGLGQSLQQLGQDEEAIGVYRQLSRNTDSALADDAILQQGLVQYDAGQYHDAIQVLNQFESQHPESSLRTSASYWLGLSYLQLERWEEAARVFAAAAKFDPQHELMPAISFSLAEALHGGGQQDDARDYYQLVQQGWPQSEWGDDSAQMLVQIALDRNDHALVKSLATEFDRQYPESDLRPLVWQSVARSQLRQELFEDAIATLSEFQHRDEPLSDRHHYLLALSYLGADRPEQALAELDRVRSATEQSGLAASVHLARGTAHYQLGQYPPAIGAMRRYLSLQPDGPDAAKCRSELVIALARIDEFTAARSTYQSLASRHPDDPRRLQTAHALAELAYQNDRRELAEELFRELSETTNPPRYVQIGLRGLAWLQAETGAADQAVETFEQLRSNSTDHGIAAEAASMQGHSLEQLGRDDEALHAYLSVMQQFPQSQQAADAMIAAARIYAKRESPDEKEKAVELYRRVVAEYPQLETLDAILYQLAWTELDLGQTSPAYDRFVQIHRQFPDSRYWSDATYRLAARAAQENDSQQARQFLDVLINGEHDDEILSHALYLSGQLAAADGEWETVSTIMQRLLDDTPSSSLHLPAEYWLAESYYRRGDFERAADLLQSLATRIPLQQEAERSWLAMVPLRQAQILAQQQQWTEAYELASQIESRFPSFRQQYEVDYLLGRCLASQGKLRDARVAYERVVRSPSGSRTETAAMAQWMIGESHFHQKNYDDAIRAYHRVETLYAFPQWQAGALLQAGKCYEQKKDWANAIKMYAQLLKDYPKTSYIEQASQRLRSAQQNHVTAAAANRM